MKLHHLYASCALALIIGLTGCGLVNEDEPEPPVVEYVTLNVTGTPDGEGGEIKMTTGTCTSDPDSGFFVGNFTGADGRALTVKIKGFSTGSSSTYTCTQASDNSEGGVGNKFDGCSVALMIPDTDSGVNTYAMHRDLESAKDFSYGGSCTIETNFEEPRVTGSINCSGLVQTDLQGAPRNPIDPSITADISSGSSFFCDL
jgi:hypothetical protein